MSSANDKEIKEQAAYILTLAKRIHKAATNYESNTRNSGTIHNLTAELSKESAELRRMARWGWKQD